MATQPIENMGVLLMDTTTLAPALKVPDTVLEGTPTCSICGALDFRFYEQSNRLRILVVARDHWPSDLNIEVLTLLDRVMRRYTPKPWAIADLLSLESADWFLPSGVTVPDKVAILMTYTDRNGASALESTPVEITRRT